MNSYGSNGSLTGAARGGARRARLALTIAGVVALACAGCTSPAAESSEATATASAPGATRASVEPPQPVKFTIAAAGDILPHDPLNQSAAANGDLDYTPLLAGLDPWVKGADLALCHMEAPVVPPGQEPSGYPMFAAPRKLVTDVAEQGWDGCSTASNHSVDRGFDGITATLDALDEEGLGHVGTARKKSERTPQVYTLAREGREIDVAHLSATYGLNGLVVPEGKPWSVDLLDADRIIKEAKQARRDGAELVVVSMHAGVEYTEDLTDQQETVTKRLAASRKVDLIIGHHAHIPQRIARLDGGPDGKGMWVAYGLGNMISNQSSECCDARTSNGVLMTATVTQAAPGKPARVTAVKWTPTTVDRAAGHRLRALRDALSDPGKGTLPEAELRARYAAVRDAVGDTAQERTKPPVPTGKPPAFSR
ncbi:CapA family protein [Myceligenerans crystallogenes]|uniref:CapA family protein n=1 Tax=Myceligenerans crystallogenes TaxID=316335 RepID=A0ABN2NHH2_9MICO